MLNIHATVLSAINVRCVGVRVILLLENCMYANRVDGVHLYPLKLY